MIEILYLIAAIFIIHVLLRVFGVVFKFVLLVGMVYLLLALVFHI